MAAETVHVEGLDQLLRRLKAFPKEMSVKGGPVRVGVQKAAAVIRDQAKINLAQAIAKADKTDLYVSTGTLNKSVRAYRAKANAREKGETYHVGVPRRLKYPEGIKVRTIGAIFEYGSVKFRPIRWMLPAFESKKGQALQVMIEETEKGIARIERKLGAMP